MNEPVRTDSKTIYETAIDIRYGQRFNEMNARLYRHMDFAFGFAGLFGGSGAMVAALSGQPVIGVVSGVAVTAAAIIERLVRPIEKAIEHERCKAEYTDLLVSLNEIGFNAAEAELHRIQARSPTGFASLGGPAYNANLLANGRPDWRIKVTRFQKFVACFA